MSSVVDYIYGSSKVEAEVAPCQQYGPGNGGYVSSNISGIPLCQQYGPGNGGYVSSNIPGIPLCQPYGTGNGGYVSSNIPGIPLCQPYSPGNGGYFLSNTPGVPLCQQGIPLSPQYGHGNGGYVWSLYGDGIGGYVSSSIPYMLFPQLMDDHVECLLVARELFEQELFQKIQSEGEDFLTFESVSKTVLSKLNLRMKRICPFEDEQFYIDIIEYHIRRLERVENIKAYYELMKLFVEKEYEKYGLYHEALCNLPSEDDQRVHEIVSSSVIYASDVLRHYLMDFVDKKDLKGLKKEEKLAALDSEKDMWIHRVRQGCLDCEPLPPWVYICGAHIHCSHKPSAASSRHGWKTTSRSRRPRPANIILTRILKREFKKDELVEILAKFSEIESLSAQSSMGQPGGALVGIQTPTPYVVGQQHGGAPVTMMAPTPPYVLGQQPGGAPVRVMAPTPPYVVGQEPGGALVRMMAPTPPQYVVGHQPGGAPVRMIASTPLPYVVGQQPGPAPLRMIAPPPPPYVVGQQPGGAPVTMMTPMPLQYVVGQQPGGAPVRMIAPTPQYDCWASGVNPYSHVAWGGIGQHQQAEPSGSTTPPGRTYWSRPPSH